CPPWDFAWTDGYVLSKDIMDQESELKGCDCEDDECDPKTCACLRKAMTLNWSGNYHEFMDFAYDENGCIQSWFLIGAPIWECNSKCGCSSSCRNRVVQKGRTQPLDIFKTPNFGWGIRARETIPQGAFIGIYAGELITEKESDHRAAIYDQIGSTYQFNLDNHIIKQFRSRVSRLNKDERQEASVWERRLEQMEEGGELVIDAGLWGNLTRFLNHSCDPNLFMYPVWTEEPSIYRPFLAFFSRRVIEAGEELTFDYKGGATEDD
ncbi:SET domain-containing protein, partial [Violaceomyces palustris]